MTMAPAARALGRAGSVTEDDIALGDRIIVQVNGSFQPGAAMPLFHFPTIPFTSTTRRTIIKAADLV
jgi:hypothetical protein